VTKQDSDTAHREPARPLFVNFDGSVSEQLRAVVLSNPKFFLERNDAKSADLVLFGTDEIRYIRNSPLYRENRPKSICITETDTPSYWLPGLYAANRKGLLTASRTKTIDYLIAAHANPNPEIAKVASLGIEKQYLYSFMGKANSWPRKRLFRNLRSTADTIVEAIHSYHHWENDARENSKEGQRRRYAEVMAASKFSLCPRGCGISSYRLFESMSLGVCPVIISDNWRPVEEIDWSFAIFIPEKSVSKVDQILRRHEHEWKDRGDAALAAYKKFLHPDLITSIVHKKSLELLQSYSPARETTMSRLASARYAGLKLNWYFYKLSKYIALRGFYHLGIPVPVPLTQPLDEQVKRAPW
jgi:hypothetical protein